MKQKMIWILRGLAALVLSAFIGYWFFIWPPDGFPSNKQVVQEINRIYPEASANVIQDTLFIDENHVIVPFISKNQEYGMSYWVWKNHKWRALLIDTKGQPKVWKVKGKDPSSYAIVWNIHPEDRLGSIQFYLVRDRNYVSTNGEMHYSPRVQMEEEVSLREKSYGMLKLPQNWATVLNSLIKEEAVMKSAWFSNGIFPLQKVFFGWIPYDQKGEEVFPERTVNGDTYVADDIYLEHVMILNEEDLEVSK